MLIKIKFESEMPIYEQLKRQIIIGIAKGELERGEELPSVRQLAGDIGINLHTVNKVYNILKEEGYLVVDRRKGARVKEDINKITKREIEDLKVELEYTIGNISNKGINKEDFLEICSDLYDEIKKQEG